VPIRKHGAGWEVRIQHGGRRYSKTVATRSDALLVEARMRQQFNDSRAGRIPQYTFEEALRRWLNEEHPRLKSSHASLVKAILPHGTGRLLSGVAAIAEAIRTAGNKSGLGPATINRRLALVKRVAKLSYKRWKWLDKDYGAEIELLPGEVKRSEWVTPQEARRLMQCADPDIREAIRWAVLTGLRRGEMLGLQPHYFRGHAVYLPTSKSGKPRSVPLPAELDPKKFPFGLNPTRLDKGFQAARRKAGLGHIRFHDLRRSYATWLLQGGAGLKEVQDLLGHANISMTSRYLGSSVEHLRSAVGGLPSMGTKRGSKNGSHRGKEAETRDVQPASPRLSRRAA
jgi:integrase